MIPKPARETSKPYLEYIKTLPCVCRDNTCIGDVVPHHTTTRKAGGNDYATIPLCATHHHEVHFIGKKTFQKKYNIEFAYLIVKLNDAFTRLEAL